MKNLKYIIFYFQFVVLLLIIFISCITTSNTDYTNVNKIQPVFSTNYSSNGMIVFEWYQHIIQSGETLSMISEKYGISYGTIIAVNNLNNARRLRGGQIIRIPSIDGIIYQIKEGDSLLKISSYYNVPLDVILDVNELTTGDIESGEIIFIPSARQNDIDLRVVLHDLFSFPLQNREIINKYGITKDVNTGTILFHEGVDFKAKEGETVMAAMDGIASIIGENNFYGKYILMNHSNGYKTLYAHMNSFSVNDGEHVKKGQNIGETGNTGNSIETHLHFGIYDRNNRAINPLEVLK